MRNKQTWVLPLHTQTQNALQSILTNCQQDTETHCMVYQGPLGHGGYGQMGRNYRGTLCSGTRRVHRAVWILNGNAVAMNQEIRHLCDNPRCANIDHLAVGSSQDNANDRVLPLYALTNAALINRTRKITTNLDSYHNECHRRGI